MTQTRARAGELGSTTATVPRRAAVGLALERRIQDLDTLFGDIELSQVATALRLLLLPPRPPVAVADRRVIVVVVVVAARRVVVVIVGAGALEELAGAELSGELSRPNDARQRRRARPRRASRYRFARERRLHERRLLERTSRT
jgi:hypothetical protein